MTFTEKHNSMSIRDTLLAANDAGTLLETLAATAYDDVDSVASTISNMHNCGEIDMLAAFEPPQLDAVINWSFFALQNVFRKALPQMNCSADVAVAACESMFAKAGHDGAAGLVYDSLTNWFRQDPVRVAEGLALLRQDLVADRQLVRPVLLACASHDTTISSEEAFDLSNRPQMHIRLDALWALGRVVPTEDERLLTRALDRFDEVIEAPGSDKDAAHALEAALHLLHRTDGKILQSVEPLLVKACTTPAPETVYTLAFGLQTRRNIYSPAMIDATFSALQHTGKQDLHTIAAIDSILYQWDLDGDRQRVLAFLVQLLNHSDDAIEFATLRDFRHRLGNEHGAVLGWYIVSLLLTGEYRLCRAASSLLPYNETRNGLDIDLSPFSLTSACVLYLSRKVLGYCIVNKEGAAALLLSCLRAVSDADRAELEHLVRDVFLMNYLTAIDWFEAALFSDDPAQQSVQRLSQAMNSYVTELEQTGSCSAFRPNERERQLEAYRLGDFVRGIQKKAEEGSLFSSIAHKSTMLYGTASIAYIYRNADGDPDRQEISLGSFEHATEIPRMEVMDPVGLHYAIYRFRSEPPPS